MMPLLVGHAAFSLRLLEPVLYLDASDDTAVLRGYIDLGPRQKHAIRTVSLVFHGHLTMKQPSTKRLLVKRHLGLDLSALVGGGNTRFSFEMRLALGDMPETIDSKGVKVQYWLTAHVRMPSGARYKRNSPVHLVRVPFKHALLSGDNVTQAIDSRRHHAPYLEYQILVADSNALAVGATVPLTLTLWPVIPGVRLLSIVVFLLERRCLDGQALGHATHVLSRMDPQRQCLPAHVLEEPWQHTLEYILPDHKAILPSTPSNTDSALFGVSHSLKVLITLVFPELGRSQRSLSFETDIRLQGHRVAMLDSIGAFDLPAYNPPPIYEHPPAYVR